MGIKVNGTEVFTDLGEISVTKVLNVPATYGPEGLKGTPGLNGAKGPQGDQGPQGDLLYGANCSQQADCQDPGGNCLCTMCSYYNCYYYDCYDCNYSA